MLLQGAAAQQQPVQARGSGSTRRVAPPAAKHSPPVTPQHWQHSAPPAPQPWQQWHHQHAAWQQAAFQAAFHIAAMPRAAFQPAAVPRAETLMPGVLGPPNLRDSLMKMHPKH